jgi:hypothetical protein
MSYFPYEYYTTSYFPSSYFSSIYVIPNSEIEFIFVIQTQMDQKLGISIEMENSLIINRTIELSLER